MTLTGLPSQYGRFVKPIYKVNSPRLVMLSWDSLNLIPISMYYYHLHNTPASPICSHLSGIYPGGYDVTL